MHALRTHKCLHALVLSKSSKHAFNCHYRAKMLTRAYNTNACMRSEHKCLHALVLSKSSKHAFNCHYRAKMLTRAYNTNACMRSEHKCLHALMLSKSSKHAFNCHYRAKMLTCAQNTQMLACAYAEQVVKTRIQLSLQSKNAYTRSEHKCMRSEHTNACMRLC